MSDQNKLAILRALSSNATLGKPARFTFNSLTKSLNLSKEDLDTLLVELERNRFITHYNQKGVDGFTVILNQKALDAAQDESFI
jgi:DNA-binding Lrp family transcriptional regulator